MNRRTTSNLNSKKKPKAPLKRKPKVGGEMLVAMGVRSGLEDKNLRELTEKGIEYQYEGAWVRYEQPAKMRKYAPDIILKNLGIIIETKGLFNTADRQKHLLVKAQHPDLEIRFVFSNPNAKISKKSSTTYAMWAEKNGFKWAKGSIKDEWLREAPNEASLATIRKMELLK